MGFPRQEYWDGLPFPFLGDLLNPGIKFMSLGNPTPQYDGGVGFGEIIEVKLGQRVALMLGLKPF